MTVALSLEPYNRFVLRSAAALYVGIGEPDRAVALLSPIARDSGDPWIISAEIAVASVAERRSRLVSSGRSLLASGGWNERSISELAAEIATQEAASGRDKHAKKHFRTSLLDPTENSVAQARSVSVDEPQLVPLERLWEETQQLEDAWEARAIDAVERADFAHASDNATDWLKDQPFSASAAMFASYIASSVTEEWGRAIEAAEQGLNVHKDDPSLSNNLAFALIQDGTDLVRARSRLQKAARAAAGNTTFDACITATKGLLEYRSGNVEEGRELYNRSARIARMLGKPDLEATALVMHAREVIDVAEARSMLKRAKRIGKTTDTVLQALIERAEQRIEEQAGP